jgi:chemotaxis protein methyltransferase CheR
MTAALSDQEFALFRSLIEEASGIAVSAEKRYLVENRLIKMVVENGCETYGQLYEKIKGNSNGLRAQMVDAMTTNETLWFRDEAPFLAWRDTVLPEMAKKGVGPIKIWSAACSTGQEPYSIAMMAQEAAQKGLVSAAVPSRVSILATDISPRVLQLAKNGRYDPIAMSRGMFDPALRQRYFTEDGRVCILKPEILKMVQFKPLNLKDSFTLLGTFDMIWLRNVAIYFAPAFKADLFNRLAKALNPGGYLVLGSAETLTGITDAFEPVSFAKTSIYRVRQR